MVLAIVFLLGVVVGFFAIVLAMASGGAGHGHYVFARALFPLPMLITRVTHDTIELPSMAIAILQFPVYGIALGWAISDHKRLAAWLIVGALLLAHLAAAMVCFSGFVPNFS